MPYRLDDDLCDYDGKCWRTYPDDVCEDKLSQILREWNTNYLTDKDEDLLEKFVPNFFNRLPREKDLHYTMRIFLMIVNGYRMNNIYQPVWDKQQKKLYTSGYLENHSKEDRKYKLQKKIQEIKKLIGEDIIPEIHLDWLNSMLDEKFNSRHYRKIKNSHTDKIVIKNYLSSLKSPDTTDIIKEFIEKLD